MNLILIDSSELDDSGFAVLSDHRARHIADVLKTPEGGSVQIGLIDGPKGRAVVREQHSNRVVLECAFDDTIPPRPAVDLLLALPRPKVMRRLWAPIASLGVGRIVLTNAARVERNYFDTHVLQPETYRPLLIEGLQQARDTRVPEVLIRRQLKPFIEDEMDALFPGSQRLMADPEAKTGFRDMEIRPGDRVLLAVGPEGGWVDYERDVLARRGFRAFRVGPRILRTDTACIALLALMQEAVEGMDGY